MIAEAGLNHNGDLQMAKRLVDAAVISGANAVKFQKRTVAKLAVQSVLDAPDDRFPQFGSTYREIREHIEFSRDEYVELVRYCEERKITFLCTPLDVDAANFLEHLGVCAYKVASHSMTNLPMLDHLAAIGKPVIMSTGMCTLDEIDEAVGIFQQRNTPLALMHCVSSYPQEVEESNLLMISVLRDRYGVPVGYSGHEMGYLPTLATIALRAAMVERQASLLPAGVVGVEGEFDAGAVVAVVTESGQEFARGICRRSATEVRDHQSDGTKSKALVHRDHVVILMETR